MTEPVLVPAAGACTIWVFGCEDQHKGCMRATSHLCWLQASINAEQYKPLKGEREGEISPISSPLLLLMGTGHSHGNKARGVDSLSFFL